MSMRSTSTPKPAKVPRSWVLVEPYIATGATIRSPVRRSDASVAWIAPIPDARATPASPPASSAYAAPRALVVGFAMRL